MKTKLRSLRNESWRAWRTERKKTLAEVTEVEDVAEDVDLRPARPPRPVAQVHRHPAGLQRGAHRPPHVDRPTLFHAPLLVAQRRQPALHLRDGAVDGGEILGWAGGKGAVELGQRARGGQGLGALDQVAFEFAPQVALEAGQLVAVDRRPVLAALGRRLGAGAEAQRAADPLHVDADHAGALLAAEGGDRQPRQVAQRILVARFHRVANQFGELLAVEAIAVALARRLGALVDLAGVALADPLLDRTRLGGTEEIAVEDQLEDAAVVLGLGDRCRQRLAEVVLRGPGHVFERREGVEDLRGPDRHPLAAQLFTEAEQPGTESRRAGVCLRAVGRSGVHASIIGR